MIKKILIGFLGVLLVGVLVFGAVNRTMALGNYPNAGQRYGQHNANFGTYRGWAEQEGTVMQGDGWRGSGLWTWATHRREEITWSEIQTIAPRAK
ncbi:MAG: hypothetical protein ACUVSB_13260 [Anaerolineae bacterium]